MGNIYSGVTVILNASAVGPGESMSGNSCPKMTFQAVGKTTSGAGAATVDIEVSNTGGDWLKAGTITLTLATSNSSDGLAIDAPWGLVRANLTSISGAGAQVSVSMGAAA